MKSICWLPPWQSKSVAIEWNTEVRFARFTLSVDVDGQPQVVMRTSCPYFDVARRSDDLAAFILVCCG